MRPVRTIALILLLVVAPQALLAQDLVRVEVLVFKYANGQSDRWPADEVEDFSALIDPRERARLAAAAMDADANPQGSSTSTSPAEATQASAVAEPYVHDGQLSANMQRALNRLNASAAHEVLSVTTWLQALDRRRAAPPIRVRGDSPLRIEQARDEVPAFSLETGLNLVQQAPPPVYRLDGSVRIRQRQFRHAELNLVWTDSRVEAAAGSFLGTDDFEIHRLRQSRPIQLGRIEYFDSAFLGALILVEPWQPPPAPVSAEN